MTQPFKLTKDERITLLRELRKPSTTVQPSAKDKLAACLGGPHG